MADTTKAAAAATTAAPAAKTPATPKPKAEPKLPRFNPAGTIRMLTDEKSKKPFGDGATDATVNPKRGKSKDRFANYKNGMTVGDLAKAYEKTGGSMSSDLDWDIKHKFVEYVPPKA